MKRGEGSKRARLVLAVVAVTIVSGAMLLAVSTSTATSETAAAARMPTVVCVTDWDQPAGNYAYRPRRCDLHRAGHYPVAGVNIAGLRRMHWRVWNGNRAVGQGKHVISTYGLAKTKVVLKRPKRRCGSFSYSKVKAKTWTRNRGATHVSRWKMPITSCLR
jgi:hypothetical protein